MRKTILYVAMSLDGYLADQEGSVDWISGDGSSDGENQWYEAFYDSIDCIFMGKNTYHQIIHQLSPSLWLYGDKQTYVFTQETQENQNPMPQIQFTQKKPAQLLHWLKHRKGKDIWICGGSQLISALMAENLIDEYHITLIPCLLGGGLPLFSPNHPPENLKLRSCETDDGMIDLVYEKR